MSRHISVRRLVTLASVSAVAVVPLGAAGSADAATTGACLFTGAAGPVVSDPNNANAQWGGVQSIWQDVNDTDNNTTTNPVQPPPTRTAEFNTSPQNDTDDGNYEFATGANGQVACAGVNGKGTATPTDDEPFAAINGSITSKGQFRNTVCGTGVAYSDEGIPAPATYRSGLAGARPLPLRDPADDTLVTPGPNLVPGGAAAPTATSADYVIDFAGGQGTLRLDEIILNNGEPSGTGDGVVSIVPDDRDPANPGGNCVTTPVSKFIVEGEFAFEVPSPL